jgi:hypothetical protein
VSPVVFRQRGQGRQDFGERGEPENTEGGEDEGRRRLCRFSISRSTLPSLDISTIPKSGTNLRSISWTPIVTSARDSLCARTIAW